MIHKIPTTYDAVLEEMPQAAARILSRCRAKGITEDASALTWFWRVDEPAALVSLSQGVAARATARLDRLRQVELVAKANGRGVRCRFEPPFQVDAVSDYFFDQEEARDDGSEPESELAPEADLPQELLEQARQFGMEINAPTMHFHDGKDCMTGSYSEAKELFGETARITGVRPGGLCPYCKEKQ